MTLKTLSLCILFFTTSAFASNGESRYKICFSLAKEARFTNTRAEIFCKKANQDAVNCLRVSSDWWNAPERSDRICSKALPKTAECMDTAMNMWLGRDRVERMCSLAESIEFTSECLRMANKSKMRRKNVEIVCTNALMSTAGCIQEAIDEGLSNLNTMLKCRR